MTETQARADQVEALQKENDARLEYADEFKHEADLWGMSAKVLLALADGAVLCKVVSGQGLRYEPLEPQP